MKLLSKEEEQRFYNATVQGGTLGGIVGLAAGTLGVVAANKRYPNFRALTLPFKTFLAISSGSFAAIISADKAGRRYEALQHPDRQYVEKKNSVTEALAAQRSTSQKALDWAATNKYSIVFASWVASMGAAFAMVSRSPLSTSQKLVQARVYAQGLTLGVMIVSLAFETSDMGNGQKRALSAKEQNEAQWRDMMEAEEVRIQEREMQAQQGRKQARPA